MKCHAFCYFYAEDFDTHARYFVNLAMRTRFIAFIVLFASNRRCENTRSIRAISSKVENKTEGKHFYCAMM